LGLKIIITVSWFSLKTKVDGSCGLASKPLARVS
jgi:hypothetical protein